MGNYDGALKLRLNHPMVDWITVTTFNEFLYRIWRTKYISRSHSMLDTARFQQYIGTRSYWENGTIFVGSTVMPQGANTAVVVSGRLAEGVYGDFLQQPLEFMNVPRIDIQVTVRQPEGWSQVDLLSRLDKRGKTVRLETGTDSGEKAQTVYIGSRHSDRVTRVYQKVDSDGKMLLRFETEFKKERALSVMRHLKRSDDRLKTKAGVLLNEVQQSKDDWLEGVFARHLMELSDKKIIAKVSYKSSKEKTVNWLLSQCLPSLIRIINDHDCDERDMVRNEFKRAIQQSERW